MATHAGIGGNHGVFMVFDGSALHGVQYAFFLCALGGTLFFFLRVLLFVFTGLGEDQVSGSDDPQLPPLDEAGPDGSFQELLDESDAAFKLLSLNSISAFIMMFGWVGLSASTAHGLDPAHAICAAVLGGLIMMGATSSIFFFARKLVAEGSGFKIEEALGKTASVYLRIPPCGRGRVTLNMRGVLHEIDAESDSPEPVESFSHVRVIAVLGPMLVRVSPLSGSPPA